VLTDPREEKSVEILEYDDVNPIEVLALNLTSLNYPLTPERVAKIRQMDSRPFPFFALYFVVEGIVAGQVGVFRLPVVTTEGDQQVGGLWAVCTHPSFRRQGIASRLSDEAHARMRQAELRFSTLGTSRRLAAYALYKKHGYVDAHVPGSTFARCEDVCGQSDLRATQADATEWHLVDRLFNRISKNHLGFARRPPSFIATKVAADDIGRKDVWLVWKNGDLVGYALARRVDTVLSVYSLLLEAGVEAAEAVAAIANKVNVSFLRVRVDHEHVAASLRRAGYPPVRERWGVFMIKSLLPQVSPDAAFRLLGIGSERFLISQIDLT
jgi:GNAT superfamily N-acetyltransferase